MSRFWLPISMSLALIPGARAVDDTCDRYGALSEPEPLSSAEVRFTGTTRTEAFGYSVANVGDFNHDGIDDVAIGAPAADPGGRQSGAVYVFFGPYADGDLLDWQDADVLVAGPGPGMRAGWKVASAGDVNGDGIGDMLIGSSPLDYAPAWPNGVAFVLFGADAPTRIVDLSTDSDVTLLGVQAGDKFGADAAGVGDFDGDGFDDVLVGASGSDEAAGVDAGAAYLFTGPLTGLVL
ncbi:MAG TPA: integrin alpha, partial [Myxococcota bacterium]|nr:integrin alpha [Myxococcota bacterium]